MNHGALPIAPRPHADELVSSWLSRTAACYDIPVTEFRQTLCPTDPPAKARPDIVWDRLEANCTAAKLRLDPSIAIGLDLKHRWPRLATAWLPSTDGAGRARNNLDLAWCHACLAEGHDMGGAYLDAEAALPLVFCHRHAVWRQDFCRRCRPFKGPQFVWRTAIEFVCTDCGVPLRSNHWSGPWPSADCGPAEIAAAFQVLFAFDGEVRKALLGRSTCLTGAGRVSARQFLAVLRDLTHALLAPDLFRTSLINHFDSPLLPNLTDHAPQTWDQQYYHERSPLQRARISSSVIALLSDEPVSRLMSGARSACACHSLEWLLASAPRWIQAKLIQNSASWPVPLRARVQAHHRRTALNVDDVLAQFHASRAKQA